jgi:S1-C subfamily serine protease
MYDNANFRWFLLTPIVLALFVIVTSPVISWVGSLEDALEQVRQNPNDASAHYHLGISYSETDQHQDAITHLKKAIQIEPDLAKAHHSLGFVYKKNGQYQKAIISYKEAIRIKPENVDVILAHINELEKIIVKISPSQPIHEPPEKQFFPVGTGFIFSKENYIITNYHVVKNSGSILTKFINGETVKAKVVAKDIRGDIAILKLTEVPPFSVAQIKLGDSSQSRMGEKVFTIGYPASNLMGERPKYSEGVINAMTGLKDDPAFFQVSLPIQPGNSGGPLFNERGEVIGITTASLSKLAIDAIGAIPQNVNYAIKSSFIKNLLSTVPDLMLSKLMLTNTGIVVISSEPKNSLPDFIEQVSKNIVLIEMSE